jgi:hypothetical protein
MKKETSKKKKPDRTVVQQVRLEVIELFDKLVANLSQQDYLSVLEELEADFSGRLDSVEEAMEDLDLE